MKWGLPRDPTDRVILGNEGRLQLSKPSLLSGAELDLSSHLLIRANPWLNGTYQKQLTFLDSVSLCLQSAPSGNTGPIFCHKCIHLDSLPTLSPRGGGVLELPLSCCVSQVAPFSPCPCPKTVNPSCRGKVSRRQRWGFAMIVSKAGVE